MEKKLYFILLILASTTIGFLVYTKVNKITSFVPQKINVGVTKSSYEKTLASNKNYAIAENLFHEGKHNDALNYYKEALKTSNTNQEKAQIEYRSALVEAISGNRLEAVKKFRSISENVNYSNIVRAEAIEYMGRIFYSFGDKDRSITKEIFSKPPYSGFTEKYKDGNFKSQIMYRKLFEYSSTIYPSAISNLYVADWYARWLNTLTYEKKKEVYKTIIRDRLNIARNDFKRHELNRDINTLVLVKQKEAIIVSHLVLSGDNSFGDPEKLFDEVINLSLAEKDLYRTNELFSRFNKALFLTRMYKDSRASSTITTLEPLYNNNYNKNFGVYVYLANMKDHIDSEYSDYKDVLFMSKIDSGFKKLLIDLGWKI